jgi:hypothetical protein
MILINKVLNPFIYSVKNKIRNEEKSFCILPFLLQLHWYLSLLMILKRRKRANILEKYFILLRTFQMTFTFQNRKSMFPFPIGYICRAEVKLRQFFRDEVILNDLVKHQLSRNEYYFFKCTGKV